MTAAPVGVGVAGGVAEIDALGGESGGQLVAAAVASEPGDEGSSGAEAGGGDGLVGALAAGALVELVAADGLAGRRQFRPADEEVGVGRANHDHVPNHVARHAWPAYFDQSST